MAPSPGAGQRPGYYAAGYRLGLADARTGGFTFICGDLKDPATAQRVAGYQAGLAAGRRDRHAEPEPEAGS